MKCAKCEHDASVAYQNGDLCKDCFIDMLVKRIKKELSTEIPFVKDEKVFVDSDLAKVFLEKANSIPIELIDSEKEAEKIVISWSADDEASAFYEELISSQPDYSKIGQGPKIVKLFKTIIKKELKQAAEIVNIEFEVSETNEMVNTIQKKYPSSTFGLVNASVDFKRAIK